MFLKVILEKLFGFKSSVGGGVLQFTDVSGQGSKRHGRWRPPWLFEAILACPSHHLDVTRFPMPSSWSLVF
jgi:hypothetical protein